MLAVDLKHLGKKTDLAVRYLTAHLEDAGRAKGSKLQFTSTNLKTVKLLLRKFLHDNGLENHRVVSVSPGLVEVLGPKIEKSRPRRDETITLNPKNETIPYYQANADLGVVPKPPYRRRWKP